MLQRDERYELSSKRAGSAHSFAALTIDSFQIRLGKDINLRSILVKTS